MTDVPETQYAACGGDHIAYQVFGEGDVDLLWVPASGDCIDLRWDWPPYAHFLEWLGTKARVISFDRRGTGESDPPSDDDLPLWERWADDARAVLDAVGSERAVICGITDSGAAAVLFVASHPSRALALMLINCQAQAYPETQAPVELFLREAWGTPLLTDFCFLIRCSGTHLFVPGGRGTSGCTCRRAWLRRGSADRFTMYAPRSD